MSGVDWRAVRELLAWRSRLKDVVENALMPYSPEMLEAIGPFRPPVDLWETADEIIVDVELPGLTADQVELRLEGDSLTLAGRLPDGEEAGVTYIRIERPRGRFTRTIQLPEVPHEPPTASLENGVLEIRLAKGGSGRRSIPVVGDE